MASFNFVAPVYDSLAQMVFGDQLRKAAVHFVHLITENQRITILGGGTGQILEQLAALGLSLEVVYVDQSSKMLERAKKRDAGKCSVKFVLADARDYEPEEEYDVLITPFFLDCFTTQELTTYVPLWTKKLRRGGRWFFADFVKTHSELKNNFVKVIYLFFQLTAGLEVNRLPDYSKAFTSFKKTDSRSFAKSMVESRVYVKLG